jgi:hypothetical protein
MSKIKNDYLKNRKFILNQDCNDMNFASPPGKSLEWIRDRYRDIFAAGADVLVADVALPDVVQTISTPSGEICGERFGLELDDRIVSDRGASCDPLNRCHWYRSIDELRKQGTDVLYLGCEEARKAGALVLAGMRMADAHHGMVWLEKAENPLYAKIISDHPEWCNTWKDGSLDATLNYAIPEVQDHRLQILRELVTNYDVDGLELDWMRWCRHFPDGKQKENMHILTAFVRRVRDMLDETATKKGRDHLILGHRVPMTLHESLNIGCDVGSWAKNGCADFLAPMDFLLNDLNLKTDEFVKAVEGTGCLVYPGFGTTKYSFGYKKATYDNREDQDLCLKMRSLSQFRATSANWYAWGADGGSSFNMYFWKPEENEFYRSAIAIMSDPEKAYDGPRHYVYLPTWKDGRNPTGNVNAQILYFNKDTEGHRQVFKFRMADGRNGEKLRGTLQFRIYDAGADDKFNADLNGIEIAPEKLNIEFQPYGEEFTKPDGPVFLSGGPFVWPQNLCFTIPLEKCPSFCGDNELGITFEKSNREKTEKHDDPIMEALEIMVT